ncbi:MAG: O-acetylhomoserine aminocarboxypropyltransferase/cysteine synthase [Clostridiales bacterium]|nr:O-acetylhomoserine aminocarboxypropyltransferase/cysteine synthase [Clostridiales bacterium]
MDSKKQHGFDTRAIHYGFAPDERSGTFTVPIHMASAYTFKSSEYARRLFTLEEEGNIYTRMQNPTTNILEERLASLEGGIGAVAASSGNAAEFMTFLTLASSGDNIISSRDIYGGSVNLFGKTMARTGISCTFVDGDDPENFARATNERTKAYFFETVGNPTCNITDIEAVAKIAREKGIPVIVDNTLTTPYLFRPKDFGANIIIHSTTKFLSAHGTIIGGITVDCGNFIWKDNPRFPDFNQPDSNYNNIIYADIPDNKAFIVKLRAQILRDIGACQSPFNAWLTLCGMETLSLRMERHCQNAKDAAEFLLKHPAVEKVNFPAIPGQPHHQLAMKYFPKGIGGVLSFDLKGGREAGAKFIDSLQLFSHVANLGDTKSLATHPASSTHSQLSLEQLEAIRIGPGTVRLSLGLEDIEDLIADLEQALTCSKLGMRN